MTRLLRRRSTARSRIKRPRSRRPLWFGLGLFAFAIAALLDRHGLLLASPVDDVRLYHGALVRVVRVVDGDTLEIDLPDPTTGRGETRVRLLGIDCPEHASPDRPAEPGAVEATAYARSRLDGAEITLRLEPDRTRGAFGRLLAHVDLADGTSLNGRLLARGLARADDRWPHARLVEYARLEREARRKAAGIWSEAP